MKAKQIRIGNLVMDGHEVEKVNARMISMLAGNHADFDPIQLTEEWLIKFGFSQMTDTSPANYRMHKSKMFFYIRYGTFTTDGGQTDLIGYNGLFIANKFVRVIRYVHELQNLYFALTGEELTLKP
ncbi:MAG: hypothetical protein RL078_1209 [Bacteroidota bacterium]|jgi:hypothetical protein